MSFLDDVDELESKLQVKRVSSKVLIAIVAVSLVIVFLLLTAFVTSLQADSFSFDSESKTDVSLSESNEQRDSGGEGADSGNVDGANGSASASVEAAKQVVVYVTGEVKAPGVYSLSSGARVNDAIEEAGGATSKAVLEYLNLASLLEDGQHIVVPDKKTAAQMGEDVSGGDVDSSMRQSGGESSSSGKVNINSASAEELQTLNGIGPALSQRIVEYREAQGRFSSIEDITNVSGIGEKKYLSIKDSICL